MRKRVEKTAAVLLRHHRLFTFLAVAIALRSFPNVSLFFTADFGAQSLRREIDSIIHASRAPEGVDGPESDSNFDIYASMSRALPSNGHAE
jgi:hypothetical protein